MAHQVIISYSRHDKPQADAICNRLEAQEIRCWIAPRDVPAGTEYAESIVKAIESAEVLVLIYSYHADKSRQVRREVERAVSSGIKIVPVRIDDAKMSNSFEYYVGSIHWLDAITPPLEQHIDKLATELKALLSQDSKSDSAAPAAAANSAGSPPPVASTPATPVSAPDNGTPSGRGRNLVIGAAVVSLAVIASVAGYFYWQKPGSNSVPVVLQDELPAGSNEQKPGSNSVLVVLQGKLTAGSNEWMQVSDTTGFSWNEMANVCNTTTGACGGMLGSVDMNGWTWASIDEVGQLFSQSTPHPGGIAEYSEAGSTWAPAFLARFESSDGQVRGLSRTLSGDPDQAHFGYIFDQPNPKQLDDASTVFIAPIADGLSNQGGWFYRQAVAAPEP